ncbi:MAG: leucyl aminopeptidase [bacterium]|nr:leucyl aminopeptidase [bacterium]
MKISFSKLSFPNTGVAVIAVTQENVNSETLAKFIAKSPAKFKGKFGHIVPASPPQEHDLDLILLVGLGKKTEISTARMRKVGANMMKCLNANKIAEASIILDEGKNASLGNSTIAAHLAYGASLRAYTFNKYITDKKKKKKISIKELNFRLEESDIAASIYQGLDIIKEGVFYARDLVSEPANILSTENYANRCEDLAALGLKVQVLGEKEMRKLGMGSLLSVGLGSAMESKLVVLEWNGAEDKKEKPLAFIGKGVVFDTGGISLKPPPNMGDMKSDMGGSAAVVGLMKVLATRNAKVNVVGVIGLVENMPSGTAQRPGDIVTSMSGQTIEVLNTDAEGRLVLADALWYTKEKFNPKLMVNLATLTGAIVVSLADIYAGLFSNDDALANNLIEAGCDTGEKLWRFPLVDEYDRMLDSPVADMQNIGNGRGAGSITAAQFLKRFVGNAKWAHLDIAGVAMIKGENDLSPKGATGFGVRLLNSFVKSNFEK